jgi:pre-mRNA-processing factor SLU7
MKDNLAAREAQMEAQKKEEEEAAARDAAEGATKKKNPFEVKKDVWGGDVAEDVQLDPAKLMDALKREEARDRGEERRGWRG